MTRSANHLEEAQELINKHFSACNTDKYANSPISNDGVIFDDNLGKGFNIGNANKYISRYVTEGYSKSNNVEDLLKAIHYLTFEVQRKLLQSQESNKEKEAASNTPTASLEVKK